MDQVLEFFKGFGSDFAGTYASIYENVSWIISLGAEILISIVIAMVLTYLCKITFLKKKLAEYASVIESATASENNKSVASQAKDKLLSTVGTIISFVVYAGVCLISELLVINAIVENYTPQLYFSIPTGAAITWIGAKGLYTMIHKLIQRIKTKKELKLSDAKAIVKDITADLAKTTGEMKEVVKVVKLEQPAKKVTETKTKKVKISK